MRVGTDRLSRKRRLAGQAAQQAEAEQMGVSWNQEVLHLGEVPAPEWVAHWYGIEPQTPVFLRRRREWMDDEPNQVASSYYLLEIVRDTPITEAKTGPGGSYARLEDMGYTLARFREEIRLAMPTPDERRELRLEDGIPIARVRRVAFATTIDDPTPRPVEVFESVMAGDRVAFVYEFDAPE
jgi:GntR family transcriptional regulator